MGNWRTIEIQGHMAAEEAVQLREDLTYDYMSDAAKEPISVCLCWGGGGRSPMSIGGLGMWVKKDGLLAGQGNLFERDYGVEDVKRGLERIAAKYPTFTAVVHCGGDYESAECVASLFAARGQVWQVDPLVQTVGGAPDSVIEGRLLKAVFGIDPSEDR